MTGNTFHVGQIAWILDTYVVRGGAARRPRLPLTARHTPTPPPLTSTVGCVWDARTGRLLLVGSGQNSAVSVLDATPTVCDGAAVGTECRVPLVHTLTAGHTDVMRCFHYSPADASFVTAADDGRICLWSPAAATEHAVVARTHKSKSEKGDKRAKPYDKPRKPAA